MSTSLEPSKGCILPEAGAPRMFNVNTGKMASSNPFTVKSGFFRHQQDMVATATTR